MNKFTLKSLLVAIGLVVGATAAQAQMLSPEPGTQVINGVTLMKGAKVQVGGQSVELTTVAAGLRKKKKLGINFKVYVAQVLLSDAKSFDKRDDAQQMLKSTDSVAVGAVSMTFLMGVDGGTVFSSFRDSLVANGVDLKDPSIQAFLAMVQTAGEAVSGKTLTLLVARGAAGDSVTYENAKGQTAVVTGPAGLAHAVYSIWLGVPADPGLADLKAQFLTWNP